VRRQYGAGLDACRRQRVGPPPARDGQEVAPFGTRTETKNVNSVRFIMAAIEYEANRQVDILESGGAIVQETRLFDPDKAETRSLRSKEDAHDYRYFPDPDLLPLELEDAFLEECRAACPSFRMPKRRRYEAAGPFAYNAAVLTLSRDGALVRPSRRDGA
jgi:aspartyl-tRNA(Asn)/glutamyl-tRNA(Gln) amidotransferase subunit B